MEREIEKLESLKALADKAKELTEKKIPWHWHYFPPFDTDCEVSAGFVGKFVGTKDYKSFIDSNNYVIEIKRNIMFVNNEAEDLDVIKQINELWYSK